MKKLLVLIMALVMALSLAACGGGDAQEAEETMQLPLLTALMQPSGLIRM